MSNLNAALAATSRPTPPKAPVPAEYVGPTVHANLSMSEAMAFCDRAQALADRICGSMPRAVQAQEQANDGIFPGLEATAGNLDAALADGNAALSRIEGMLP